MNQSGLKYAETFKRLRALGLTFAVCIEDMPYCHCKPTVTFLDTGMFGVQHQSYELKLMQFLEEELARKDRETEREKEQSLVNAYRLMSCFVEQLGGIAEISPEAVTKSKEVLLILEHTPTGMKFRNVIGGKGSEVKDGSNIQ